MIGLDMQVGVNDREFRAFFKEGLAAICLSVDCNIFQGFRLQPTGNSFDNKKGNALLLSENATHYLYKLKNLCLYGPSVLDDVVDDITPAEHSVQDCPLDGVPFDERDGHRKHRAETDRAFSHIDRSRLHL